MAWIRKAVRAVSVLLLLGGLGYVGKYGLAWYTNERMYSQIFDQKELQVTTDSAVDLDGIGWEFWNDSVLSAFQRENPQCAAVVCIPDTALHYPVVQTEEEGGTYYLYRDFNRKKNVNGTIFLDYRCSLETPFNLILYGHNMRNGSMFGTLKKYVEQEFFQAHPSVYLNYGQTYKKYDICSVITLSANLQADQELFRVYDNPTEEERKDFVELISKRSIYDTGVEAGTEDEFLMLSTCYYGKSNGRMLIVARQDKTFDL